MCLHVDNEERELGDLGEPANYKAALLDPKSDKWLTAINVEMQSMKDNEKTDMDGAVHTFKARLVAKGFTQTYEVDYEETFSPVADIRAIRILIAIAAFYNYEIWQMNVKTAFLNGHLSEEVYMVQPNGFVNPKYPNRKFAFSQNCDEPCVYMKASGSYVTFLILYVNDILIMRNNIPMLQDVKSYLGICFAMKDLGEVAYILRIKIFRDRSERLIGLCQSAYIEKILKRYFIENSKRRTIPMQEKLKLSKSQGASTPAEEQRMKNVPYASAVGSIMYAVRCTHPDVAFAQNIISRFQQNLGELHWTTIKNILKYLTDADDLKSQAGYVFVLNGGVVDWKSTKQSIFATSSTDAEYIAAFDASKEAVWIRKFISRLGVVPTIEEPISMYCDNTGVIAIAKDHGITKGARHFYAKVHYLRETIEMGDVRIEKFDTDDNLADPFTKALAFPKHSELTRKIGMIPVSSLIVYALESNKLITVAVKLAHEDLGYSLRRMSRDGVEMMQFLELKVNLDDFQLPIMQDRWSWSLVGSRNFLLLQYDALPTRLNLSRRGLDLQSIFCPICNKEVKSSSRIFVACSLVRDIYRKIASWWDVSYSNLSSYEEWLEWFLNLRINADRRDILKGVFYIMWWLVWSFRNKSVFGSSTPSKAVIFDDLVSHSFYWYRYICNARFS
ncbi:retrotransposon protein, putative, ty1-copia subclass [Tanacetum coccineum]|uniref:Retrotransposon protein, putative, ty1-copia subclass n=1 Tax=Tanacetum coccineum TaxID=301880 RepID=A0ABQ5FZE3_9ASTR